MGSKRVDSSVLDIVDYDEGERVLKVRFRSGRVYHYYNVPRTHYEALLHAKSKGSFFNRVIRRQFRGELRN
jgi:hypothetical protein